VATAADAPVKLSLGEAIKMSAEKNLDVRAELYNPAQYEAEVQGKKGIYDPLLSAQTSYNEASQALVTGSGSSEVHTFLLNSSLSRLFWTGATAALNFNNSYTDTNSTVSMKNYWQSNVGLTLTQPLLKNIGREVTEAGINVSRLSKFASIEKFNSRLMSVVAQVRNEYFKLHSLREQLEVKKVSLGLARKILGETKARVAAGVLPAMEILNAEFGAVSREKDLIDAEKAVNDQIDVLRLLLQIESRGDVVTTDLPNRELLQISEDEAIKRTLTRPDIREQKRNLEIAELQTRVYRNKMRPDLALVASVGSNGLDHTFQRDYEKLGSFDYPVWSIGLNFSYPLGNNAAENDYRKSRLKTEQTALQIRGLEEGAVKDVKAAIRGVVTSHKQIEVAERGRAFAEERLRAFIRKNEVGLATTKDVLDVENDFVTAKSNQITSAVNYANAVTLYWQTTGELLERERVNVVEGDADKLYTNTR
jgi:outer membrane protein TolC